MGIDQRSLEKRSGMNTRLTRFARLRRFEFSRRWILPMAAVFALTLAAIHPFLAGVLPQTADGTLHLYRLVALDHAMADGTLWPRYVPGLAYGYGTPMFNYYSPMSLYVMQVLHVLGLSFLNAWLVGMVVYAFVAGLGAFLLGRAWGGIIGGLVTSAAYTYAPYTLFDSIWRGTVSEFASLALLPYVLWALWRLATYGYRRDFLLTVFAFALFVPMHNVITLHGAALIGVYTLILWLYSADKVRALLRLGGALALAMTMTAFFWLPALTETGYVKIDAITANLPEIDVTRNLTALANVLRPPMTADATQMQPPIPIALSWVQMAFGLIGAMLAFFAPISRRTKALVIVSIVLLVVLVFMNTTASATVWTVIPLIRYSQFPWRLVGLASLLLALLSGIGVSTLVSYVQSRTGKAAVTMIALASIMIYAIPWLYTIYLPDVNPQSIVDAQDYERESGYIATSSFAEYIPVWSSEMPDATRLVSRYEAHEIIPRLDPPQGITLDDASWSNTSGNLTYSAEENTVAVFDWFYVPGWSVMIDGEPVDFAPTEPEGLIAVELPAGTHQLEIRLEHTQRQTLAVVLSVASVFAVLGVLVVSPLWKRHTVTDESHEPDAIIYRERGLLRGILLCAIVVGVGMFALKIIVFDQIDTPLRATRFANGIESGVDVPLEAVFGDVVTLLGYDEPQRTVAQGDAVQVNLYWTLADATVDRDFSTVLTLWDDQGNKVVEAVDWQPGGLSTTNWLAGDYYLQERAVLTIPPTTAPLNYRLTVGLLEPVSNQLLEVSNSLGVIGVTQDLGTITVTLSDAPAGDYESQWLIDGFALNAVEGLPESASVGQAFTLSWVWTRNADTSAQPPIDLVWANADTTAENPALIPIRNLSDEAWPVGETLRGLHKVFVPGELSSGSYSVSVRSGESLVKIGQVEVSAPERVYTLPDVEREFDVTWANGIRLLGADVDDERLTFYWTTDAPIFEDLRMFVHLLDADDEIVRQFDGVPANWARPVAGWDVGEIITDAYDLPDGLPDTVTTIRLGWYDPNTAQRVTVADGGDVFDLPLARD